MAIHGLLLAATMLAGLGAAAPAQMRDPGRARAIRAIVADIRPDDPRATPRRIASGIRNVDANGDGIPDYLFSLEAISSPGWCGTGGCRTQLWLGRRGAAPRKIFDAQIREAGLRSAGHRRVFDVDLHGSACHTFGASPCPASFAWDEKAGRMVEHKTADGSGTIRMLRPLETLDRAPPPPVRRRLAAMVARCRAAGGAEEAKDAALTVPDIDGDGIRDWLIVYLYCAMVDDRPEPPSPMVLFASAGHPATPVEAVAADWLSIALADGPASVFELKGNGCRREEVGGPPCARIALHWDADSRRLLPARKQ